MTAIKPATLRYILFAYVILIVTGSLYPFSGWRPMSSWSDAFLFAPLPRYITRNDVSTNLLAYLPLGYLISIHLFRPGRRGLPILLVWILGALLSLSMEGLQVLIPTRVASTLDIFLNSLGALTGALLALHHARWLRAGQAMYTWRHTWFQAHGKTTFGLWLLVLWILTQFALVPQPGVGWLGIHLNQATHIPESIQMVNTPWFFATFLELIVLGTFTACLLRPGRYVGAIFLLLVIVFGLKLLAWAMLMKPKVMGGMLSPETLAGFVVALWLLLLPTVSRHRRGIAIVLLAATDLGRLAFVPSPLWPGGSLLNLVGLARHLAVLWPWLALALLLTPRKSPPHPLR
ncbi:MAG: VanZ family protein [Parasulfuritortus sp.]|nr:VanZ family protein [Parasulfuritortus sp.]